jgi:hypothetical protein
MALRALQAHHLAWRRPAWVKEARVNLQYMLTNYQAHQVLLRQALRLQALRPQALRSHMAFKAHSSEARLHERSPWDGSHRRTCLTSTLTPQSSASAHRLAAVALPTAL